MRRLLAVRPNGSHCIEATPNGGHSGLNADHARPERGCDLIGYQALEGQRHRTSHA